MLRSGYADDKSRYVIKQVTALGCHIDLLIADVTKQADVTEAMRQTTVPIVGIIQGAMVLRVSPSPRCSQSAITLSLQIGIATGA
jgi:hypothetical protein